MLEDKKKEILDNNYYINKRQNVRLKKRILAHRNRIYLLGILTSIVLIIALYFILPVSNVYDVSVVGNRYLEDDFYQKLSNVDDNDKYLLSFNGSIEKAIKECDLIEEVKVKHLNHNIIQIEVKEKNVVGYVNKNVPVLILEDGSELKLEKAYNDILLSVPLIEGYTAEELKTIVKGFNELDPQMIDEISEIHKYPFTYDPQMMEVVMRDGYYVYLSYYAMPLLNDYYLMVSGIDKELGKPCIYVDEMSNSAYTSDCPFWKTEKDEKTKDSKENDENETNDDKNAVDYE